MPLGTVLNGTVEVDETCIGGNGENKTRMNGKTPVAALIERKGGHTQASCFQRDAEESQGSDR
jgi:hypothetical protein